MILTLPDAPEIRRSSASRSWRYLSTPAATGAENMAYDVATLNAVEEGTAPPTFRLFSFSKPTVSYGRLQKLASVQSQFDETWDLVQRPTGGGMVRHQDDRCLSLCWRNGLAPIPHSPREQYRWIHALILKAFSKPDVHMASCADVEPLQTPFEIRQCFQEPVGYDLMAGASKIVGGALYRRRGATLYQGSILGAYSQNVDDRLINAFQAHLF